MTLEQKYKTKGLSFLVFHSFFIENSGLHRVKHICPQPVTGLVSRLVFTVSIAVLHTNQWFPKTSESVIWLSSCDHHDWSRRTEGWLSITLAAKGACFLLNKKEASSGIDPNEWWWREEWWKSRESLWLLAIGTWGYPIRTYKWLEAMSVMFPVCKAPGPHSIMSEEFLPSTILRPKALR